MTSPRLSKFRPNFRKPSNMLLHANEAEPAAVAVLQKPGRKVGFASLNPALREKSWSRLRKWNERAGFSTNLPHP
jgi:hypothetical protein